MEQKQWICVRQVAGPLVKECRYQRPVVSKSDLPSVARSKRRIQREIRNNNCFCRTVVDRCELFLAVLGTKATFYTLTFVDGQLPEHFDGVKRAWRSFLRDLRRHKGASVDYLYCVESRHGDGRYHIHAVFRDRDVSPEDVIYLWPGGHVDHRPMIGPGFETFRDRAVYMTKERTDGVRVPTWRRTWNVSRSMYRQLPKQEKFRVATGEIPLPPGAVELDADARIGRGGYGYRYKVYLLPGRASHARARARDKLLET